MKKAFFLFTCFSFIIFNCINDHILPLNKKVIGKVYFIPTLHRYHATNQNYNYDSLRSIIARLHPGIIAVEIRPEDINEDTNYLKKSYPLEMRMMRYWFPSCTIIGFDWLNEDIEGKLIPDNYWKDQSVVKKLERKIDADSFYTLKTNPCYARSDERDSLLQTLTLMQLLKSKDGEIVTQQYDCLNHTLLHTPYEALAKLYAKRDQKILANIRKIIANNNNRCIVIITGDDHYEELKNKVPHHSIY